MSLSYRSWTLLAGQIVDNAISLSYYPVSEIICLSNSSQMSLCDIQPIIHHNQRLKFAVLTVMTVGSSVIIADWSV